MIEEIFGEVSRTVTSSWRLAAIIGLMLPAGAGVLVGDGTFSFISGPSAPVSSTGPDRSNIRNHLADLSAERYEAGGMIRTLRFVGVVMDPRDDRLVSPADRAKRDAAMTLAMPTDMAAVMIAAEPINWTVNGARERARIGFEGAAPFAINAPSGVMSGFRIGALGASRIAYPIDPIRETERNVARLCSVFQVWGRHFDVDMVRMEYVLVANPSNLTIANTITPIGGRIISSYGGSSLRSICYGPQRSTSRSSGTTRIFNPVTRRYN